jgi:site-specific DNA-methyltransferase (adenine-specific)
VSQATFNLRGHNPDVLTCIANLSNDEVFTPPEFANRMLDTLEAAWADSHGGAVIWEDPAVKFLDPFTKSGVFLREIVARLTIGLAGHIPDLADRVDHILTTQVYGIGITELTSLIARRSLYCSKYANSPHSVAKSFTTEDGNVWFTRTEHTWMGGAQRFEVDPLTGEEVTVSEGGRCKFCAAPRQLFDRDRGLETHAYAFIHTDDIKARMDELFGAEMQFDVVIGNPPYQMTGGGGGTNDSSIYHLFVEQAIKLEPRFLSMVIPSRWLAGGRGLDGFRRVMLTERHIRELVDYTKMSTAFPGVDFEGGVGYFLWDTQFTGDAQYTLYQGDEKRSTITRDLGAHDIFIRDSRSLAILEKVRALGEPTMETLVSSDTPFGLATNFAEYKSAPFPGSVPVQMTVAGKRTVGHTSRAAIRKNTHLIDGWKVFLPEAYGERGAVPALVLGPSIVAPPGAICTQTYLVAGPFESEPEAMYLQRYLATRFARFLVSLRKITQHALRSTYSWVPVQAWDHVWTDADLCAKYGITDAEIAFIESMVRPVELNHE